MGTEAGGQRRPRWTGVYVSSQRHAAAKSVSGISKLCSLASFLMSPSQAHGRLLIQKAGPGNEPSTDALLVFARISEGS